jgi:4a-hydroxytetrahydrobiopterin dehydratase
VNGTTDSSDTTGDVQPPDGWEVVDGKLHREFAFTDFVEAFGFMCSAALVAQAMDHHPDWSNSWNRVVVDLSSHDAGRVTERDVSLARRMGELAGGRGDR